MHIPSHRRNAYVIFRHTDYTNGASTVIAAVDAPLITGYNGF